jgi:hypothetical protein
MIWFLRVLFGLVLASMLWVTGWASFQCPLFAVPREVYAHPWFIATLFDAYWGFVTFYVWVCFKQSSGLARGAWFCAIMLLGNIAMAAYCLSELFAGPVTGRLADRLAVRRDGPGWLGVGLALAGLAVVLVA